MPEDELVEVDQVLRRDAMVGALRPGLEVGERRDVRAQHPVTIGKACALLVRPLVEAARKPQ